MNEGGNVRKRILMVAVVALGAVPALAPGAHGGKMSPVVSGRMTGAQETPKKGEEGASGKAVIRLDAAKGKVCWQFSALKKVASPLVSHIHKGAKGKAGPVFIPLGGKFKAKGCTTATKSQITAVESNPRAFYVNIHNKEYPDGVVRGQLTAGT
jgi:CHRD domain